MRRRRMALDEYMVASVGSREQRPLAAIIGKWAHPGLWTLTHQGTQTTGTEAREQTAPFVRVDHKFPVLARLCWPRPPHGKE